MNMARATLSVVSHGQGQLVSALLRDLASQTIASELQVIVTHNIPEPPLAEESYAGLDVAFIRNDSPKGFGANHNAALRLASAPWVIVVNPDIRIPDSTLIERLITAKRAPEVGLVAPVIRNSGGGLEDSIRYNLDPFSLIGRKVFGREETLNPEAQDDRFRWVAGMFMALPLGSWQAVGGFDERFFLYCEDYDLCARLSSSGHSVVVDHTLEAIHDAQRASRRSAKYLRWHIASIARVWTSSHFWSIWASDRKAMRKHTSPHPPTSEEHRSSLGNAPPNDLG